MPRIPIHYESFLISNGLKGAGRQIVGRGKVNTLRRDAADREVSPTDHHIAGLAFMDPGDVAAFRAVCLEVRVLFVVRCPGAGTHRYASLGLGASGKPEEDKEGLKVGHDLVMRGNGQLIVGDYDLMSVWTADGGRYEKLEFTRIAPGASSPWTSPEAERLFERLNRDLTIRLEHGANDDWKPTNPKWAEIREGAVMGHRRYAAFTESGGWRLITSPGLLRQYYRDVLKAEWPYRHIPA
jgi:hypothetical protein